MGVPVDSGMTQHANAAARRSKFNAMSAASPDRCWIRIDVHIDVRAVKFRELTGDAPPDAEDSATIRQRVIKARDHQRARFLSVPGAQRPGCI
jgi:predicted ATPase with chaperone activity